MLDGESGIILALDLPNQFLQPRQYRSVIARNAAWRIRTDMHKKNELCLVRQSLGQARAREARHAQFLVVPGRVLPPATLSTGQRSPPSGIAARGVEVKGRQTPII